jgi:hypothetical protein
MSEPTLSHRVSQDCDCQPCRDVKSLARELTAERQKWTTFAAFVQREIDRLYKAWEDSDDALESAEFHYRHSQMTDVQAELSRLGGDQ